ncbi:MAG: hypothetical protein LBS88_12295, partial [Tannerellaceae bacterium]|nr:hypothetical protein [Tannerellaceae bacterium]
FKELSFERIKDVILRRIVDIPHAVAWNCNLDSAKQNKEKLKKYYNIHKDLRCFIMANGPGLKKMDLTLLKNEIIICMNRMYLSCNQNNFTPAYIVVHDKDTPGKLTHIADRHVTNFLKSATSNFSNSDLCTTNFRLE